MIIGFTVKDEKNEKVRAEKQVIKTVPPKKSLVKVRFLNCGCEYTYYNDKFDLEVGDIVFVDGKLEGKRGRVTEISYGFKVKLSDFKRVIAKADTDIKGEFASSNMYFLSFDKNSLPFEKVISWFIPPVKDEDEFVDSVDDKSFLLDDLGGMGASVDVFERGEDYAYDGAVKYLSLDGTSGKAIVEGSKAYTVEFEYKNGEISKLVCDCYCVGACKHEVATLLILKYFLKDIEENFKQEFEKSGYFSAVNKDEFLQLVLNGNYKRRFSIL